MNQLQRDLIVGSLLGDGKLDYKDGIPFFTIRSGQARSSYANLKFKVIKDLCHHDEILMKSYSVSKDKSRDMYIIETNPMPELAKYESLEVILNELNHNSFCLWMIDRMNVNYGASRGNKGWYHRSTVNMRKLEIEIIEHINKVIFDKFGIKGKVFSTRSLARGIEDFDKGIRFYGDNGKKIDQMIIESDFGYMAKQTMINKLIMI